MPRQNYSKDLNPEPVTWALDSAEYALQSDDCSKMKHYLDEIKERLR